MNCWFVKILRFVRKEMVGKSLPHLLIAVLVGQLVLGNAPVFADPPKPNEPAASEPSAPNPPPAEAFPDEVRETGISITPDNGNPAFKGVIVEGPDTPGTRDQVIGAIVDTHAKENPGKPVIVAVVGEDRDTMFDGASELNDEAKSRGGGEPFVEYNGTDDGPPATVEVVPNYSLVHPPASRISTPEVAKPSAPAIRKSGYWHRLIDGASVYVFLATFAGRVAGIYWCLDKISKSDFGSHPAIQSVFDHIGNLPLPFPVAKIAIASMIGMFLSGFLQLVTPYYMRALEGAKYFFGRMKNPLRFLSPIASGIVDYGVIFGYILAVNIGYCLGHFVKFDSALLLKVNRAAMGAFPSEFTSHLTLAAFRGSSVAKRLFEATRRAMEMDKVDPAKISAIILQTLERFLDEKEAIYSQKQLARRFIAQVFQSTGQSGETLEDLRLALKEGRVLDIELFDVLHKAAFDLEFHGGDALAYDFRILLKQNSGIIGIIDSDSDLKLAEKMIANLTLLGTALLSVGVTSLEVGALNNPIINDFLLAAGAVFVVVYSKLYGRSNYHRWVRKSFDFTTFAVRHPIQAAQKAVGAVKGCLGWLLNKGREHGQSGVSPIDGQPRPFL